MCLLLLVSQLRGWPHHDFLRGQAYESPVTFGRVRSDHPQVTQSILKDRNDSLGRICLPTVRFYQKVDRLIRTYVTEQLGHRGPISDINSRLDPEPVCQVNDEETPSHFLDISGHGLPEVSILLADPIQGGLSGKLTSPRKGWLDGSLIRLGHEFRLLESEPVLVLLTLFAVDKFLHPLVVWSRRFAGLHNMSIHGAAGRASSSNIGYPGSCDCAPAHVPLLHLR